MMFSASIYTRNDYVNSGYGCSVSCKDYDYCNYWDSFSCGRKYSRSCDFRESDSI